NTGQNPSKGLPRVVCGIPNNLSRQHSRVSSVASVPWSSLATSANSQVSHCPSCPGSFGLSRAYRWRASDVSIFSLFLFLFFFLSFPALFSHFSLFPYCVAPHFAFQPEIS